MSSTPGPTEPAATASQPAMLRSTSAHLAVLHGGHVLVIRDGGLRLPRIESEAGRTLRERGTELRGLLTMDRFGADEPLFHLFSSQDGGCSSAEVFLWDAPERFTPPGVHSEWIPFDQVELVCVESVDQLFARSWMAGGLSSVAQLRNVLGYPKGVPWHHR